MGLDYVYDERVRVHGLGSGSDWANVHVLTLPLPLLAAGAG